ncbi:MAG TPA: DNA-processing protein DprA [Candidatus Saccharimonadales bacterium]|jgi:DNA processing protein
MITGQEYNTAVNALTLADSPYAPLFEGILPAVQTLYVQSHNLEDLLSRPRVAIVGSRKVTPYGKAVTQQFARELAGQGIVIISGLAYGVDAIAHQAALDAGGLTIAVLPSSLQKIYPTTHTGLARRMVEQGGALISEYPAGSDIAWKNQFVERNRIVSGMSDVLLITEAAVNSGTIHTARFALDQGKDVLAVPGSIMSPTSAGTNNLIRTGAMPATGPDDVIRLLGLALPPASKPPKGSNPNEQLLLDLLADNVTHGTDLMTRSALPISDFNQTLTMMELTGKVRALGANQWSLGS